MHEHVIFFLRFTLKSHFLQLKAAFIDNFVTQDLFGLEQNIIYVGSIYERSLVPRRFKK